ncbi:MAG: ABC transporter permease [Sedimentisphaerales bacterium]|nr:ABC transporter permease [Sedimentisphaerales bacterium]
MFWFRLKRTMKLGVKSLWMHRLRSILTMLGIIFGVCSVIAMLAIGEGASQEAQDQIARLGSRNIIIRTVKPPEDKLTDTETSMMQEYGLTYNDAARFRETIPNIQVVVPSRKMVQETWYRNRKVTADIVGTIPWYTEIKPIKLLYGRFLEHLDLHHQQRTCVIDERIFNELFVLDDPINTDIKISSDYYRVVGVVSAAGPANTANPTAGGSESAGAEKAGGGVAGTIYIPLTTVKQRFGEINLQISSTSQQIERVELQEITVQVADNDLVKPTRDVLEDMLSQSHKKKDYQITVPLELLNQAKQTKKIFSIVLGSIAAISLLVGGIGIMNIMLATVSERTREIGIRRALGAKRRDIVFQFLSETAMLTMIGGLLGIFLGSLIPFLVERFAEMPTIITGSSLLLSFGISAAVGVTFGMYPAYRAAHMDPIESLRHE